MKKTDYKSNENNNSTGTGMKRRDFLKWAGIFSATFLVSGLPASHATSAPETPPAPRDEKPYLVTGWCIPH